MLGREFQQKVGERAGVLNCLGSQIPRKAGDSTLYIFSRSQNLKRMHAKGFVVKGSEER
jgi:hypothetical protein